MVHKCNVCGKKFETGRGLHIHQSKVHSDEDMEDSEENLGEEKEKIEKESKEEKEEETENKDKENSGTSDEEINEKEENEKSSIEKYVDTGIPGADELLKHGIWKKSVNLVAGNPGSGKSIMGLQILKEAAKKGENCLYMSYEESEEALKKHMRDFGWDPDKLIEEGNLKIKTYNAFKTSRTVEALFKEESGELRIDAKPLIFGDIGDFEPDRVVVDSLTAISSAFVGQEKNYRLYINQLFKFFRNNNTTAFVIAESNSIPNNITDTGQAEFLADGVILLHRERHSRGFEIYKMRGSDFEEKIAPMEIRDNEGIVIHPDKIFFADDKGDIDKNPF